MEALNLCGQWHVRKKGETTGIQATVPGCIHTDLLSAGKIEDPYYRDNEARQMWIGETDWVYSRTFHVDRELLECDRVLLKCDGLDTLAAISLNEAQVGKADNQFRIWEFDVKPYLRVGENTLEICFESTLPYIAEAQRRRSLAPGDADPCRIDGSNRIRKSQCNYGWDWGPECVTAGIWRKIELLGIQHARIADVHIAQDHSQPGAVGLQIEAHVENTNAVLLTAHVSVFYEGKAICQANANVIGNRAETLLSVKDPELWWPNGLGGQPLYDVRIDVQEGDTRLDTISRKIGLRTLELDRHPDQWGESFQFVVNGQPFFAKGANWIPADTFVTRVSGEQYEDLIKSAADAHMNMLRVWGGGIYEEDVFYDLCDRYGICVWQDFMFACSAYPAFDSAYMDNVKQEAIDNVKRLRHHPSIALWCGNNELEQISDWFIGDERHKMSWAEYRKLFDELLPDVVYAYDPQRTYWPSSPHSPLGDRNDHNNPTCGDAHLWDVWHGRKPFEWYRSCEHRFNSEFGFQSFPEPAVVHSYTEPAERNIASYVMEWHQRSKIGNTVILQYMLSWFQLPTSFEMLLWSSQILHGMAMKYAVEHWRRSMPRGMGTLYWQINDCWPVASWASIDYAGNWKALHYMARDFYAPLLISGVEDVRTGTVEVHVTSDRVQPTAGVIHWTLTDTDGVSLANDSLDCEIDACANHKVKTLQFADKLAEYGERRILLWLELEVNGAMESHNLVYFSRPKHLELRDPEFTTEIQDGGDGTFTITVDAKYPALWVWAELPGMNATHSDRFFHLRPGKASTITITPQAETTLPEVEQAVRLCSLVDTWR